MASRWRHVFNDVTMTSCLQWLHDDVMFAMTSRYYEPERRVRERCHLDWGRLWARRLLSAFLKPLIEKQNLPSWKLWSGFWDRSKTSTEYRQNVMVNVLTIVIKSTTITSITITKAVLKKLPLKFAIILFAGEWLLSIMNREENRIKSSYIITLVLHRLVWECSQFWRSLRSTSPHSDFHCVLKTG